jgi:hypothetical protein
MTEVRFTFSIASARYISTADYVLVSLRNYAHGTASDEEIIEHINWQIEHEVVHKVLYEQVGFTACKMFDSEQLKVYLLINPEGFNNAKKINSKLGSGWTVRKDDF